MESLNWIPLSKDEVILIVDDEPQAVSALHRILRGGRHANVVATTDPTASLEMVDRYRPSLVVLDLHMPEMDGFEVMQRIQGKFLPEDAPSILVVTAADDRATRIRALELGARDFLVKPYDPYEVLLRVRNLLELQTKRRLFSRFLDSTPAAMLAHDSEGRCTYINRSALDLLGYHDAKAVVGSDIHELIHHSHRDGSPFPKSDCPISGREHAHQPRHSEEEVYWRADGHPLPVECWAYPLTHDTGGDTTLVTFVDIRERREAERHLRLANTVFESVDRALVITDAHANIVSVNEAYSRLTGWAKDEVVGKNPRFRKSGRQSSTFYEAMWKTLLSTGSWEGELWNFRKDGACYLEEVAITAVRDSQGHVTNFVAALRDLTETRRRSRELEDARTRADAANLAKSRFVANMSHEIRTPLTAIVGFAETLNDSRQSDADRAQAVDAIIRGGRYLKSLVDGILDFSKIEADKLEVEQMEIALPTLLQEVQAVGGARARAKGLTFRMRLEPPWPSKLTTDPTRAKQVLVNLVSNAIKFTDHGSITVTVSCDEARGLLVCRVRDTGIGIAPHRLPELFESFAQADASTARRHGGSGLGLTIARGLARLLGGDITAQSQLGVGSEFIATLALGPMTKAELRDSALELEDAEPPEDERLARPLPRLRGQVLLTEDNPDNRRLVTYYLESSGAEVSIAENGEDAVAKAQGQEFDLILMDMQMPVMDGLDATRMLRLTGIAAPIIALTANATESDRKAAMDAGCTGFLTKPIKRAAFYAMLAEHLPADQSAPGEPSAPSAQDMGRFETLSSAFKEQLPSQLAALRQALLRQDFRQLASAAHQLKGVGTSFGLPEATRLAGELEKTARDLDETGSASLMSQLEALCHQTT